MNAEYNLQEAGCAGLTKHMVALGKCLSPVDFAEKEVRANLQILKQPNQVAMLQYIFKQHFNGKMIFSKVKMTVEDSLDLILLPANHRNYLAEIEEEATRVRIIRHLMEQIILPQFCHYKDWFHLHWTLGEFVRKPNQLRV